ncbi:family S53 protease-like protein [Favolaschia claudopus]|uniref:tripeptidyl-peptidase II n=1 Tax=Favolaschia claudopus TaxID=2862362 RepID=A0AAV9Z9R2_9AGAR
MARFKFNLLFSLLSFALVAVSAASSLILHEHRTKAPSGFANQGPTPANHMLTLRFGLASNNIAGLQEKLLEISTPGSPEFRKWLSPEEIKSFVAPSPTTLTAFTAFLSSNGLESSAISPFGDWHTLTLPVSQANTLFGAKFTNYTHPALRAPITRTLSLSLPAELSGHVEVVHPSTMFTATKPRLAPSVPNFDYDFDFDFAKRADASATAPAECDATNPANGITPACLQALYNIPKTPATQRNNALMVTSYGEWAETADLQAFLTQFRPDLPSNHNQTFSTISLDNGTNPQEPGVGGTEADLDVEYAAGIATSVPLHFLSVGDFDLDLGIGFLDTATYLATTPDPPTVVSTSYGDVEEAFGESMARKICDGYAAATARGISLLFASGDGGVSGGHDDGENCGLFVSVFPASCPWVTAVGSTIGFNPEVAINFTGGGFSSYFPQPPYQTTPVSTFLKTLPPSFPGTGKFNPAHRAFPDLALQGKNFFINLGGRVGRIGGTSASTPVAAGIISLINDRLLEEGKPVLGFLNPFIYAHPGAFNDIVVGHNSGGRCPASSAAFDAAPGWDPLTGLGTPNYPDLLAAALG